MDNHKCHRRAFDCLRPLNKQINSAIYTEQVDRTMQPANEKVFMGAGGTRTQRNKQDKVRADASSDADRKSQQRGVRWRQGQLDSVPYTIS